MFGLSNNTQRVDFDGSNNEIDYDNSSTMQEPIKIKTSKDGLDRLEYATEKYMCRVESLSDILLKNSNNPHSYILANVSNIILDHRLFRSRKRRAISKDKNLVTSVQHYIFTQLDLIEKNYLADIITKDDYDELFALINDLEKENILFNEYIDMKINDKNTKIYFSIFYTVIQLWMLVSIDSFMLHYLYSVINVQQTCFAYVFVCVLVLLFVLLKRTYWNVRDVIYHIIDSSNKLN
jgi:hypothetical protein